MLNRLKFHQTIHDTTRSMHQQVPVLAKMISWAPGGLLHAVNSLQR